MTEEGRPPKGLEGAGGCDVRCRCGNLIARMTAAGVELKCRRCKRVVVLAPAGAGRWEERSSR